MADAYGTQGQVYGSAIATAGATTLAEKTPRALDGHLRNLCELRASLGEALRRAEHYVNSTLGSEPAKAGDTNAKPVSTPDSPVMWRVKECMDDIGVLMTRLHDQIGRIERL